MYNIEEIIYSGIPDQGMDMHSFYDGEFIWYPYADYNGGGAILNKLIKFNPATDTVAEEITLANPSPAGAHQPYQAIQSTKDPNVLWVYSTYGTRALWKVFKVDPTPDPRSIYVDLVDVGTFGGKISSMLINDGVDDIEHIVATIITIGNVVAYKDDPTTPVRTTLGIGTATYGIQHDAYGNFFMGASTTLKSFTLTTDNVASTPVTIATAYTSILDIAWDGTSIWCASQDDIGVTNVIERFSPVYDGGMVVTGFTRLADHASTSTVMNQNPSIKANDKYVMATWESGTNDPPVLCWNILNKDTGDWLDFFTQINDTVYPDYETVPYGLYPYTGQYWTTAASEIDVDGAIYISGYAPALQGHFLGNTAACPLTTMRLLKLTPFENILSNGTIAGATID